MRTVQTALHAITYFPHSPTHSKKGLSGTYSVTDDFKGPGAFILRHAGPQMGVQVSGPMCILRVHTGLWA